MQLVDTHTHLYLDQFKDDIDTLIKRASKKNINKFYFPAIDSEHIENMLALHRSYPEQTRIMTGLHPCSVKENFEEELKIVEQQLKEHHVCAIGEIGIDLYWDRTFIKEQIRAFEHQIDLAKKVGLPIVIHARDSFDEIFDVLDRKNDENLKGIFHCFTGSLAQANHILNYGDFKLGIGGVVTFKNSGLDKVVKELSLKDLVLETDAPYLTPAPYRGKRNIPEYLELVALKLCDIFEKPLDEVAAITTKNAIELLGE